MANTIRIKRSAVSNAPSTLANAELAFSESSDGLFIGKGTGGQGGAATSVEAIGGKGYFLALAGEQTVTGDKTFSGAVDLTGTIKIGGSSVTASAAEINVLDGATAGTAVASKALVVDANKDLDLDGGDLTVQNLTVDGDLTVQGTVTAINSTTVEIADKAIELAVTATPTDTTADQGGFIVKGATDKSFLFDNSSSSFKSSENLNLASGKVVKINGTEVLSGSALGSGVTGSSLTSVGTLTSGSLGSGFTTVAIAQGGTGQTTAQAAINALSAVSGASAGQVLTKVGSDAVWATPTDTGITSLNGLTDATQTFAYGSSGNSPAWSSASGVHTLNIPNAGSGVTGGLITNGVQGIYGDKTFHNTVNVDLGGITSRGGGINPAINAVGYSTSVPVIRGKGVASQSANLLELLNSSDATQFAVSPTGAVTTGSWTATEVAVAYGGTGATSASGARTNLGLAIGSDIQGYSARLDAIANLTGSFTAGTVRVVGFSATSTAEYIDVTSFGADLIDSADAAGARTTLGLGSIATQAANNVSITGGSISNIEFDGGSF